MTTRDLETAYYRVEAELEALQHQRNEDPFDLTLTNRIQLAMTRMAAITTRLRAKRG